MILSKIYVTAKGGNRTRLLNKLRTENIGVYDLQSSPQLRFGVQQKDFALLQKFAQDMDVELSVCGSSGVAAALAKIWNNAPYIVAATICLIMLIVSTQFVYGIKVECVSDIYAAKVATLLRQNKLDEVIYKSKIDTSAVERMILQQMDEVSFATCYIDGFYLKVKIVANDPPKIETKPNVVLSAYDGIVTRVVVMSGTSEVKVGERVSVGDTLIGGYHIADNTPSDGEENGEVYPVAAVGEVYGKVYTHKRFVIPEQPYSYVKTGKSCVRRSIGFNKLTLLKAGKSPYKHCEVSKREINLFSILPLSFVTYEYYELQRVAISPDAYMQDLKSKFETEFISTLPPSAKITAKNSEIKTIEGVKYLDIFYETEQRLDQGGQYY